MFVTKSSKMTIDRISKKESHLRYCRALDLYTQSSQRILSPPPKLILLALKYSPCTHAHTSTIFSRIYKPYKKKPEIRFTDVEINMTQCSFLTEFHM